MPNPVLVCLGSPKMPGSALNKKVGGVSGGGRGEGSLAVVKKGGEGPRGSPAARAGGNGERKGSGAHQGRGVS